MTPTKSLRNWLFLSLVITAAIVTVVLLRSGKAETPTTTKSGPAIWWPETRAGQLIFFAVLEGLYRDGVKNDDVDLIIPPDEKGEPKFDDEMFVYACPLCGPTFEALRLYRQREGRFFRSKGEVNTFGRGLDEAVRTRLRSQDADERRQTVEGLISRWVSQRLEMMRLTTVEREEITHEIEQGRKQGMYGLRSAVHLKLVKQSRENCPICDGSFGACKLQPH